MSGLAPAQRQAQEILDAEGPQAPNALSARLRDHGFVVPESRVRQWVERLPNSFAVDERGRVTLPDPSPAAEPATQPEAESASNVPWWSLLREPAPRPDGPVLALVVDAESLDLNLATPTGIAILNVQSGEPVLNWRSDHGSGDSLAEAMQEVCQLLEQAAILTGHALHSFALPLLHATAVKYGLSLDDPTVADLYDLSVLARPDLPSRSLDDVCQAFDVSYEPGADAAARVKAIAECVRAVTEECDATQSAWRVTLACLHAGQHPLAQLLPAPALPLAEADLRDCLEPSPDPLCAGVQARGSAVDAAVTGLKTLAEHGWTQRHSQHEMAVAVARAMDSGGRLAVEAPTGTGKTLAYLLPASGRAAASGKPVVIATATKVLQQQLRREAEELRSRDLLPAPFRQLYGVANYVCTRNLAEALLAGESEQDGWLALAVGVRALTATPDGVWEDVTDQRLRTRLAYRGTRSSLATNAASCERRKCDFASQCPMMQRLKEIDRRPGVLSVSHASLASWAHGSDTRGRGPVDLSGEVPVDIVLDEAHDIEDTLTSAWTESVSSAELQSLSRQLRRRGPLVRRVRAAAQLIEGDTTELERLVTLGTALSDAERLLGDAAAAYVHEFAGRATSTVMTMGLVRSRREFRELAQRAFEVSRTLGLISRSIGATLEALAERDEKQHSLRRAIAMLWGVRARVVEANERLESLRRLPDEELWVHRLEATPARDHAPAEWKYDRVPIHVGPEFVAKIVGPAHSLSLTSATLTVEGKFEFLNRRLHLDIQQPEGQLGFVGLVLSHVFDHEKQSAAILTNHLPLPIPTNEREFIEDVARDQIGFLSLTGGKTLALFAARSRMEAVAEKVRSRSAELEERGVRLLVQGEESKAAIARRFREDHGSVVYGLRSYWQGFDAKGETLSYLCIEKPPYPHPGDPVVAARQRAIAEMGGDPFIDYVVPKTAITLAQGFGRLIRDETDRGVALILDRRLQQPSAANRMLLSALPTSNIWHANDREDAWTRAIRFVTGIDPDLTQALSTDDDDISRILQTLMISPGENPDAKLQEAARLIFGIEQIRPSQLDIMRALIGGRDALGLLPTGSGKSLCFQLPALIGPSPAPVVVVSPLVALIKDQLDDLRGRRGLRMVQGITGDTSSVSRTEILRDLASGRIRLLYVSPERLVRDPILRQALVRQQLATLVVDEAHCVSVWGHDFRPEFRQVAHAVADFTRSPRLGLTATATPQVETDITGTLELHDPMVVREPADRPNLRFTVRLCEDDRSRIRELLRIVTSNSDTPGIIYAQRRATTEEIAALLRRCGHAARSYHAGMLPEQRQAAQDDFMAGTCQIMVATKAFGMGVNKPDIGWVVHCGLPEALDSYVQEAGRAARDPRLTADCVLLHTKKDIARGFALLRKDAGADVALARRVLAALQGAARRNGDAVFAQDALADALQIDADELHVVLAWLERAKAIEQLPDCTGRGTLVCGSREPVDEAAARRFREIMSALRTAPGVRRQLDLATLEADRGWDPDALERDLVDWSLDRLVTFNASQRLRRVRVLAADVDATVLTREVQSWQRWCHARLNAMVNYAGSSACRRELILAHFGDRPESCDASAQPCDNCSHEPPAWDLLDHSQVPDPESLADVKVSVLRAVAWANSFRKGHYGESGLIAALLGNETMGPGRPLGQGLLNCPQFGSLRYIRGGERRARQAVTELIEAGLLARDTVEREGLSAYATLAVTSSGRAAIGAPGV